jgi:nucleotide-binding universal stress UspA family protein
MKKILIATDFSDAARNAGQYGLHLAQAFNATAILFHVFQPLYAAADIPQYVVSADIKQIALHNLAAEAEFLDTDRYPDFFTYTEEGPVAKTIVQKCEANAIDLIVVGMKARHKGLRKLFGSTVTELAKIANVPVLVVPEDTRFHGIGVIAVAVETDIPVESDPELLGVVTAMSKQFNASLYVVSISKNKLEEAFHLLQRPYRLMKTLGSNNALFEDMRNKDIGEGLTAFIENFHVDVLVMLVPKRGAAERLLHHSITKEMVYHTHIPLLLINEGPHAKGD